VTTRRVPGRRRYGRHRPAATHRRAPIVTLAALCLAVAGAGLWVSRADWAGGSAAAASPLPARPDSYLGVYVDGVPASYHGITSFADATGVTPNVVSYYSGWLEQFRRGFADDAARNGAVPLVQLDPTGITMAAIASGRYDGYLTAYARAIRSYDGPVIVGFGHEMNAYWYTWGYGKTSPASFVAAWRRIVDVFRAAGARNVTWMWTVNAMDADAGIPSPKPWWPGRGYVTWVGIDGYYLTPSAEFASVFGPTIAAVRALTRAPILISETGAAPSVGQAAKITGLFAGTRAYDLLGFVWFDVVGSGDYRMRAPAAISAYRHGANTFRQVRVEAQVTGWDGRS
jgi:mannan endo-1,4-beta-mannosidase